MPCCQLAWPATCLDTGTCPDNTLPHPSTPPGDVHPHPFLITSPLVLVLHVHLFLTASPAMLVLCIHIPSSRHLQCWWCDPAAPNALNHYVRCPWHCWNPQSLHGTMARGRGCSGGAGAGCGAGCGVWAEGVGLVMEAGPGCLDDSGGNGAAWACFGQFRLQ